MRIEKCELVGFKPTKCPKLSTGANYLSEAQTPYLEKFFALAKGASKEDLYKAWNEALELKFVRKDISSKTVFSLDEALYFLLDKFDYYELKLHYLAYMMFIKRQ